MDQEESLDLRNNVRKIPNQIICCEGTWATVGLRPVALSRFSLVKHTNSTIATGRH